jgi:3-(3-hydroxy-phenyl)propionate hydroxylase
VKFVQVIPAVQLKNPARQSYPDVITVGDLGTDIRTWFGRTNESVVILRPDRFVAALAIPQTLQSTTEQLFEKLHVN